MKKLGSLITLLWAVSLPLFAEHVDPETARKVATTFLNNNGAKARQLTDLSKAAGFPNLYIFTSEEGFVIMAADDCVKPILGYSLTGASVTEDLPKNVSSWLQGYNDEIQYAIEHHTKAAADIKQTWDDLILGKAGAAKTTIVKDALIETSWGQGAPFNNLCPYDSDDDRRTVTGCVATAMAQIMYYWKYPTQGSGSHSYTPSNHPKHGVQSADFGATTYEWSNMLESYSGSYSDTQANAVATLMYHCGVSVDMDYDYSLQDSPHTGSSASTYDVMFALENYFNYAPSMHYESKSIQGETKWITMLKQELDSNRPLQYRGSKTSGGGHSFVCDGYNDKDFFHFNWGWNGNFNGFYSVASLCPEAPYTKDQEAVFGIQRISGDQQPTNLVATVSGRNVNLTWDGFEGASSYKVYCDYNLIGSTESCSYSDTTACIGSHLYFVRGVKNSNVTVQSNIATATVTFGGTAEELKIEHLEASYEDGDVALQWVAPYRLNYIDYYAFDGACYYWGPGAKKPFYWGSRFPASLLSSGTSLTSVTTYFYTEGQYDTYIYQCTGGIPSGDPIVTVTDSYPMGWNDIHFASTVLDPEQDLWVIFKCTDIHYPLIVGEYNTDDGNYYSSNGSNWFHLKGYSYFVSANLSDGTFTYSIYDGNTKITPSLTAPHHNLSGIAMDVAHQYTVKAQKGETEAEASNMIGFTRGSATLTSLNLGDSDMMTLTDGSSLTVTGEVSNSNPDNLVIENGAQLIHPSSAVEATLKKSINGYGNDNTVKTGWYTIASPVDGYNTGIAITETTYDLYAYDEPSQVWLNQKVPANNITSFTEGYGLLYANSSDQSLGFAGSMIATDDEIAVSLSYSEAIGDLKGYNLMGNPFTRNLGSGDITIGGTALTTYYVVEGGSELETRDIATYPIKPGQGFFVQATGLGQALVFNPSSKRSQDDHKPSFIRIEAGNDLFTDRAYVQLGEGNILHKMTLRDDLPKVYLANNYSAIVVDETASEIPVHFKAAEDGTYTLSINAENTGLEYLHLLDNLTGADIDLLQTQSYAFEATASDYESRFRLIFSANGNPNGNSADLEGSVTHVMDVTGRIVGTSIHENMKPGVYILRTVNGNETKTEKIIIK